MDDAREEDANMARFTFKLILLDVKFTI